MTAAGVAGGALLFQGIQSLFGPHDGNMLASVPMQPGISETVVNNDDGDQSATASDLRQADDLPDAGVDRDDAADQYLADLGDDGGDFDV